MTKMCCRCESTHKVTKHHIFGRKNNPHEVALLCWECHEAWHKPECKRADKTKNVYKKLKRRFPRGMVRSWQAQRAVLFPRFVRELITPNTQTDFMRWLVTMQ